MYPVPTLVRVKAEIVPPALIVTLAVAVVSPKVTSCCAVPPILTVAVEYPTPPSDITREEIVPAALTTAVADAPTLVTCDTNFTFS